MTKETKSGRPAESGRFVTRPIGEKKAAKFAEVEGLKLSAGSKALSQKLTSGDLKGDAYRREIVKAFKKV
ncbi:MULTISPECIES: hypothetical protein [unclassified Rhizobium]|jgi:hypothetical protein|uniref:hypothetical protein n=1 Tax=unclassified Rhizobium TaxID=2613769 RepID=UPI001A999626|nr:MULTISPECIES: hypothetical protein [unclassified Rhizobium]MBX5161503.1 hypothetical protein [Rhizobium sp. NZLR8]MBX5166394.1 hypothetical protein [Rhizobium sp. NZLR4b]MBX5170412.1 hypothetical protein [Rhizobium sp. NZLR1b]MBX5182508.1 hypothetical protein [Rhizobium sp. NZLR5]MBX5190366.1 hypothetical protein [Rhizobium sp. NZLR3b]